MTQQARHEAVKISTDLLQRCNTGTIQNGKLVANIVNYISAWIQEDEEKEQQSATKKSN